MQLLNQLREEAGKIADEAVPEVLSSVEQLAAGDSVPKVLISLIARLEQDIPGLLHPPVEPASPVAPVAPVEPAAPAADPQVAALQAELEKALARVAALQSTITPAPAERPVVG